MVAQEIMLDSMTKLQSFVELVNDYSGKFDLVSGCNKVNAKSIMGIFSLDISKPLSLYIYSEDDLESIIEALRPYKY